MAYEQRYEEQGVNQQPYLDLKITNQYTTICLHSKRTVPAPLFDFESHLKNTPDLSFDLGLHTDNAARLQAAALQLLEDCLEEDFNRTLGFRDASLYSSLPFELGSENELEAMVNHNELLSERERRELGGYLREETDLLGFLEQLPGVFGLTVSKELVYMAFHILKAKLQLFREFNSSKDSLLPRFQCFQGFPEEELLLATACPVYEDVNSDQLAHFAEEDLQGLVSSLYFSSSLQYVNLRELRPETKAGVSVLAKFGDLVRQLSRSVFFTIVGAAEAERADYLNFSREASVAEFPEVQLALRSMSRQQLTFEEESEEFLRKKVKRDPELE